MCQTFSGLCYRMGWDLWRRVWDLIQLLWMYNTWDNHFETLFRQPARRILVKWSRWDTISGANVCESDRRGNYAEMFSWCCFNSNVIMFDENNVSPNLTFNFSDALKDCVSLWAEKILIFLKINKPDDQQSRWFSGKKALSQSWKLKRSHTDSAVFIHLPGKGYLT